MCDWQHCTRSLSSHPRVVLPTLSFQVESSYIARLASPMDWSGLLPELLELILDQLTRFTDHDRLTRLSNHLHFASVCSSWQSVAINNRFHNSHFRQLPLLMLPGNDKTETRHFFSLSDGKNHGFHIPEIHQKWCCGSSQGWLVTVDGSTGEIQLFNPFSRDHIQLPSLSTFSDPQCGFEPKYPRDSKYINKVVLSANPCRTTEFVVVAIVTNVSILTYYKPGADRWITIKTRRRIFEDVIYYKGLFYALSHHGHVVTYDFSSEPPFATEITGAEERSCDMSYLVESLEGLLLVSRQLMYLDEDSDDEDNGNIRHKTSNFEVYKLDESRRQWIQMKSIGDCILFLGNNNSMSLSAQDFPECKGNSIYFNDDYYYGFYEPPYSYPDIGVFNFENGSIEPFCESPPIWTTPTFWITLEEPW